MPCRRRYCVTFSKQAAPATEKLPFSKRLMSGLFVEVERWTSPSGAECHDSVKQNAIYFRLECDELCLKDCYLSPPECLGQVLSQGELQSSHVTLDTVGHVAIRPL